MTTRQPGLKKILLNSGRLDKLALLLERDAAALEEDLIRESAAHVPTAKEASGIKRVVKQIEAAATRAKRAAARVSTAAATATAPKEGGRRMTRRKMTRRHPSH
jgi:hypothetical protein